MILHNIILYFMPLSGDNLLSTCDNLARVTPSHDENILVQERGYILDLIVNSNLFL